MGNCDYDTSSYDDASATSSKFGVVIFSHEDPDYPVNHQELLGVAALQKRNWLTLASISSLLPTATA